MTRRRREALASGSPASPAVASAASGTHVHHRGLGARAILGLVRSYQWVRAGRPSPCRFWPSCSAYAVEAVERHGALHGSWLAARRLSRCRPWGGSGFDPVPD